MNDMFYIYIYRDPTRCNEEIYVGKGSKQRAYDHLNRTDKHPFVQRLQHIVRQGAEPTVEILPCPTESEAYWAERACIKLYGRKDLGLGTLLNLTDGGEGGNLGIVPTAETLHKRAVSMRKMWNTKGQDWKDTRAAKISASKKGVSNSVEHNRRIREATGRPCTVDGVNIFSSYHTLRKTLGQGKSGSRSPNFRYL